MTIEEIKEKYSEIEDKIPSVWADYETAGIELARNICMEWDIKDTELIRVLSLIDSMVAGAGRPKLNLSKHIYSPFAFAGLYPQRIKTI